RLRSSGSHDINISLFVLLDFDVLKFRADPLEEHLRIIRVGGHKNQGPAIFRKQVLLDIRLQWNLVPSGHLASSSFFSIGDVRQNAGTAACKPSSFSGA